MKTRLLEVGMRFTRGCWTFKVIKRTRCYVTLEWFEKSPWGECSYKTKRAKVYTSLDEASEACGAPILDYELDAREHDFALA